MSAIAPGRASYRVMRCLATWACIESYVTEQALDGLFAMIAEQEANLRQNPAGAATSLAKKVFGAL